MKTVALLLLASLAGCMADEPTVNAPAPELLQQEDEIHAYKETFFLTAVGSIQVAGENFHPGQGIPVLDENKNCVSVEILDSEVVWANATAEWADGGELVLYRFIRDYGGPSREHQHTVGVSPTSLATFLPPETGGHWLFFGGSSS